MGKGFLGARCAAGSCLSDFVDSNGSVRDLVAAAAILLLRFKLVGPYFRYITTCNNS